MFKGTNVEKASVVEASQQEQAQTALLPSPFSQRQQQQSSTLSVAGDPRLEQVSVHSRSVRRDRNLASSSEVEW